DAGRLKVRLSAGRVGSTWGRNKFVVVNQVLLHLHVLASHRAVGDCAATFFRNSAGSSRQYGAVDNRQRGLKAVDVSERDGFELMGRLKRDAKMHRPDWFVNLHAVEVVTQHGFLAVQYRREGRTHFAESHDQGSR